jgi:predicted ribosome quality control (RQC) complex YloA/Tae2 family protein
VLQLLENCSNIQEIDEVRQELSEQGYLSSKHFKNKFKKNKPSAPLRFRSSDGFDIFIGKNNKQNDQLTLKLSASNDLWMHTQNIPGSHVIIKNSGQTIPDSSLLEAALLAAYHSKAKFSSGVPVDYTYVKNVKKPPGSKPGMVTYTNFKTIIVTPDEKKVNKLKID